MDIYVDALCKEIKQTGAKWADAKVSTVFIGGGTPSILPPALMDRLLGVLRASFGQWSENAEYTIEANPGTVTAEWLGVVSKHGVNRLSIGVQAAQDALLSTLGRVHTFAQAKEATKLAKACGIQNINMDVMLGLPGQSRQDYLDTLQAVDALEPTHISAYTLIVEEGTPLAGSIERGECTLPSDDEVADMAEEGIRWLEAHGYRQYEISNFAKPGYECIHNMGYWHGAWYAGMGLAAHSMLPEEENVGHMYRADRQPAQGNGVQSEAPAYCRIENVENMEDYITLLQKGCLPIRATVPVGRKEAMFETMLLGLRTTAGVSDGEFLRRHGERLGAVYGAVLDGLVGDGLGAWRFSPSNGGEDGKAFALTPRGLLLQNQVMLRFMDA